ncbi:hypothetical protein K438DRAFT_1988198 [Mycena galopus ATCC 62051]|nr:hypothetical protein K438DRAFT_1988198 [Mycena galopus ATCC 62051]
MPLRFLRFLFLHSVKSRRGVRHGSPRSLARHGPLVKSAREIRAREVRVREICEIRARLRELRRYAAHFRQNILTSNDALREFLARYKECIYLQRCHLLKSVSSTHASENVEVALQIDKRHKFYAITARLFIQGSVGERSRVRGALRVKHSLGDKPPGKLPVRVRGLQMHLVCVCRVPGMLYARARARSLPSACEGLGYSLGTPACLAPTEEFRRSTTVADSFFAKGPVRAEGGKQKGLVSPCKRQIFSGPPSTIRRETRLLPQAAELPSKAKTWIRYTYGKRTRSPAPTLLLPVTNALFATTNADIATAMSVFACGSRKNGLAPTQIATARTIHQAPKIDEGEAESVAADYPDQDDKSQVSYSWEGPRRSLDFVHDF